MGAKKEIRKLKGFTIAEVLVVLALTSLSITLSYATLTYIQKLFVNYKQQNKFLHQYTDLKDRLNYESLKALKVVEESENNFVISRDSSQATLRISETVVLLKKDGQCDTFHFSAKNIQKEYEQMQNPVWTNKLVKSLRFEVEFTKQKFNFSFYKQHEARIKLKLEEEK
jgi:hypothetical protein